MGGGARRLETTARLVSGAAVRGYVHAHASKWRLSPLDGKTRLAPQAAMGRQLGEMGQAYHDELEAIEGALLQVRGHTKAGGNADSSLRTAAALREHAWPLAACAARLGMRSAEPSALNIVNPLIRSAASCWAATRRRSRRCWRRARRRSRSSPKSERGAPLRQHPTCASTHHGWASERARGAPSCGTRPLSETQRSALLQGLRHSQPHTATAPRAPPALNALASSPARYLGSMERYQQQLEALRAHDTDEFHVLKIK